MRRFLTLLIVIILSSVSVPVTGYQITPHPYVFEPTVPDTAFAVIALYRTGDYDKVLEGCEWLMAIRTPFDSWGFSSGEEHEAKYTAMAMMALMRGENVARNRYRETLNSAAYWLIYKQNPDGSWEDYVGTAFALIALKEFMEGEYINETLTGFKKQIEEAINRAQGWLIETEPESDVEIILRDMALGNIDDLQKMKTEGELKAYWAFALSYLGQNVDLDEDFDSTIAIAMALYATGNEKYREKLLKREHFGFWGTLHYRVLDLLSVSKIRGFEDLRPIACPYLSKITPTDDWERIILADYYILCNMSPELPSNLSSLLPWQVAELARIKAILGEDYGREVEHLLSIQEKGVWKDFYNTEYVVETFRFLNVSYDYSNSLKYLQENLTWMLETTDPKTGNPVYYNVPTYYFAHAVIVFKEFGLYKELNETLNVLEERQYSNGAFPYTHGSMAGITSTSKVAWALQRAGLENSGMYAKSVSFLRNLLYTEIPLPKEGESVTILANATFLLVKDGFYIGNSTNEINKPENLDGYVVIYPSNNPLTIFTVEVNGFRVSESSENEKAYVYIAMGTIIVAILTAIAIGKGRKR